jgi:hypothetical protein
VQGIPAALTEELGRLDPWNFWFALPPDPGLGDAVVVGVTGGYLIRVDDRPGYLTVDGSKASIGSARVTGLWSHRRAARRLGRWFTGRNVFVDVDPVLCLSRANAAGPRTVRGVTIVAREHLSSALASGEQRVAQLHAKKAAKALGLSPDGSPDL